MKTRYNELHESDATPSREVVQKYRELVHDDDRDGHDVSLALVHYRGGEVEFQLGKEYSLSEDAADRATGADILAQLGWNDRTYMEESVEILIRLLDDRDSYVLYCAAVGLGHRAAASAIPSLLRHVGHPDPLVRYGVVHGLSGLEDDRAIDALIRLAGDEDGDVRNWAVFGLGSQIETDTPEIRSALRQALDDPDDDVRGEALVGLATRGDASVIPALLNEWRDGDVSVLSLEAAEECRDPSLGERLSQLAEILEIDDESYLAGKLAAAIEACAPKAE